MDEPPVSEFIENSPGIEIHQEILSIGLSFDIQRGNFEELTSKHQEFRSFGADDWKERNPNDVVKSEYYRPFHNYVSSIYTVINHSQRTVDNFGGDDLYEEYTNEIFERNLHELGEFLRQLRHYTQKRKVPPIAAELEFSDGEVGFRLYIWKKRLLEWDGWNKNANEYLEALDSKTELLDIIETYQEESEGFQEWFTDYVRLYFDTELKNTLERILLIDTFRSSLNEPHVEKRMEPTLHGYREREVLNMPPIPEEYVHPYNPENILCNQ